MSEQDEAELLRWLDGDPMTISQDELVATVRRILAERDAARKAQGEQHLELTRAADTIAAMQGINTSLLSACESAYKTIGASRVPQNEADAGVDLVFKWMPLMRQLESAITKAKGTP